MVDGGGSLQGYIGRLDFSKFQSFKGWRWIGDGLVLKCPA
jgi:hypothetical protein